jgi:hypothetical protein
MTKPSELPIAFGAKPALAIVVSPIVNKALNITDRTIVFHPVVEAPHT